MLITVSAASVLAKHCISTHTAGLPSHHYTLHTDTGMLRLGLTLAQNGVRQDQAHHGIW